MATRQPQQQQQLALLQTRLCPSCKQPMRLVGREDGSGGSRTADLLTFQCRCCGQVIATMMQ
jgi:hypothetical protein